MSVAEKGRAVCRAGRVAWVIVTGIPAIWIFRFWKPIHGDREARAAWMSWMSRRFLGALNCKVRVEGEVPSAGLIVSNHLSYVDILAIGSVCRAVFVSKSDVKGWPVFGLLTRLAGTIYVDRERRLAVKDCLGAMEAVLATGLPLVVFPEGTSSGGREVLPFRSSLLGARDAMHEITPAAIDYRVAGADAAETICYWGEMVFAVHLVQMLRIPGFEAVVHFGSPAAPAGRRKQIAEQLHSEVSRIHARLKESSGRRED